MKQLPLEVGMQKGILRPAPNQLTLLCLISLYWICPVVVVDGTGFNRLLNCVEPGYVFPSRTFVIDGLKQ